MAIVGAGPYGLSLAAHLRKTGIEPLVLGEPMATWRRNMPDGMFLKSTAAASSLSAPAAGFTLVDYCAQIGLAPLTERDPVPIDLFVSYGLWFQEQLVPQVDPRRLQQLIPAGSGFDLLFESGERVHAQTVVVATGHAEFAHVPEELTRVVRDGLSPSGPVSHSSQHSEFAGFSGRSVAVVGGGQSALESAALLREAGANVHVLVRARRLLWANPPDNERASTTRRLVKPPSDLGPGWSLYALSRSPGLVRRLPRRSRLFLVRTVLGPSGAWWLRDRVIGHVAVTFGCRIQDARLENGQVLLRLEDREARSAEISVDHVVAATGYQVNLDAISFLSPDLLQRLTRVAGFPCLTTSFESSVPGLFFSGLAGAATFGPVLRFVCGTHFAARRITAALAARASRPARGG